MRIKTQFVITMLLFGVILVVIAASAILISRRVEKAGDQERMASSIAQGASELSYLANDYLMYRESQQLKRWRSRFGSFSAEVAGLQSDKPEQKALAANIEANQKRLGEVFDSTVSAVENRSANQIVALDPTFLQVSWSRMAVQSQGLISDASRLSLLLHQEIDRLRETRTRLIYVMVFCFGALLLAGYMLTYRRILKSIETLQAGTKVIGSGKLDFRIEEKRKDEIGDLSRAFNRMSADLKTVTARKADLEKEVAERRRAEEALQESEHRVRAKLDSILSPEGDIGSLELADMIDSAGVQALMDDFYRLAGIPMSIIDLKGKILVGVGWQRICTEFHRAHPETCAHCIESDTQLSAGLGPGEVRLYKCKNHMWDIATPIFIGGKHVGNVFSGQFLFEGESLDYELFRAQARRYGFNDPEYIAALEAVPRLSREAVDTGMAFFTKLTHMLSQLSSSNIRLARLLSERDRLSDSLRSSEQRLQRAQEIAHLGGWELDLNRNELTWSDEVYRIFGLEPQEFGATLEAFLDRVHPADLALVESAYTGSLRDSRDGYEIEHRVVRKSDGQTRFVHEKCEHFRDAAGRVIRSVGMVHDITDRRLAEEQLQKAHAQLQDHARRLQETNRELESFAYSISHDLRAPLRAINGFARMLADDYGSSLEEEAKRRLSVIETNAIRMGLLIDDLLAFSRSGRTAMNVSPIDMNGLVADVLETMKTPQGGAKTVIHVAALPPAHGDPALIRQVLANLLENAAKFSRNKPAPTIEVGSIERDGEQVYFVKDNGVGFDMKYYGKLFGVFQRLVGEKEFEGTGVGLAIVNRLITRHGGRVWAEAEPGEGATFFFTLRRTGGPQASGHGVTTPEGAGTKKDE